MTRADLEKLKKEIQDNYDADMAAIKQLLSIYGEQRRETAATLTSCVEASRPRRRTSEIVEEIIKSTAGEFDIGTIYLKLRQAIGRQPSGHAPRTISQVINKLRQRNPPDIVVVAGKEGKGRRSGTYRMRAI